MSDRPFYVGYLPKAPAAVGRFVTRAVVAWVALAALIGAGLATSQGPFPVKVFEWGAPRSFVGWLDAEGHPTLRVRRPKSSVESQAWSIYHLVGVGKFGADVGEGGRWVELQGTLIYRDGQTMLEVVDGTVRGLNGGDPSPTRGRESLGAHTLVGEIVDSKCFLGVMAPGSTKPHRACATRCISGGIPPVLLVRDGDNRAVYLFLEGDGGRPLNAEVLDYVAEPVEISGQVHREGGMLRFTVNPSNIRRLDS